MDFFREFCTAAPMGGGMCMDKEQPNIDGAAGCGYRVKPGFVLREIGGEYLAIPVSVEDEPESRVAVLNCVGKFLWEQLQGPRTIAQLVRAVTDAYEVCAEEAGADIREFIDQLQENHLLIMNLEVEE